MEKEIVLVYFNLLRRRRQKNNKCRRKRAKRSRINFYKKQTQERLAFFTMLSASFIMSVSIPSQRSIWMKERSGHWWENVVKATFTPHDWLMNFRVSHATFQYLCTKLSPCICKADTVMRKSIAVQKRVALTLWFLATGADYRTIGHLFGVAKSTVCVITKEVCSSIVYLMLPEYIKMPQGNTLKEVIHGFERDHDFPQCAGVVDGTHIPIVSPQECPADFYNRKGWHSIIMQGTVNNSGLFIDVYVGWPGRVHDARVFSNSSLYLRGQNKTLLPNWVKRLNNSDVPLVILGDPAYALLDLANESIP